MNTITSELQKQWLEIAPILTIRNEREYNLGIERINALVDEVGTNENHPLYTLLDTLGILIQAYEEEHYPIPGCSGVEILRYLMEEFSLSQSDLPEVGSQSVVSEVLNGKRELDLRQIRALAERFKVSPAVFI